MKYHYQRSPKQRHIFRWVFFPLLAAAIISWLYIYDYANVIDVPGMDNHYDRNPIAE